MMHRPDCHQKQSPVNVRNISNMEQIHVIFIYRFAVFKLIFYVYYHSYTINVLILYFCINNSEYYIFIYKIFILSYSPFSQVGMRLNRKIFFLRPEERRYEQVDFMILWVLLRSCRLDCRYITPRKLTTHLKKETKVACTISGCFITPWKIRLIFWSLLNRFVQDSHLKTNFPQNLYFRHILLHCSNKRLVYLFALVHSCNVCFVIVYIL